MNYKERLSTLETLLDSDLINLPSIKQLVFHGLPGDGTHRPLTWRLILHYLPLEQKKWPEFLEKKRSNYSNFIKDLLKVRKEVKDHPLSESPESQWGEFFKDNDVLLQIDKDVRRLLPEISFFQSRTKYPCELVLSGEVDRLHKRVQFQGIKSENVVKKRIGLKSYEEGHKKDPIVIQEKEESHWEVVERILFLYAKLNPGMLPSSESVLQRSEHCLRRCTTLSKSVRIRDEGYVQGMNEIIGPIYYTLANDQNPMQEPYQWKANAEADSFYLFTNLMSEIRDFFIRTLDASKSGIKSKMDKLMDRLNHRDNQVHNLLLFQEIHPQYFSFRWITLLLSQEFPLPEVLRIWDSLLSDTNRFDFLIDLCCAMIVHVRAELLSSDFSSNMKLLQNYPPIDVRDVLSIAASYVKNSDV